MEKFQERFSKNQNRHPRLTWESVSQYFKNNPKLIQILQTMEDTDGEPDIIYDSKLDLYYLIDCSEQTPKSRVSLCYDKLARTTRKNAAPKSSAMEECEKMGVSLVTEEIYMLLQSYGPVDTKTSSWLLTSQEIRDLKGAIFGDNRFGRTFIYHNGADSYYAARGFRTYIELKDLK